MMKMGSFTPPLSEPEHSASRMGTDTVADYGQPRPGYTAWMNCPQIIGVCLLLCTLSGTAAAGSLSIVDLRRQGAGDDGLVQLQLHIDLSGAPASALEHGVTLPLVIQWRRCIQGRCATPLPGVHLQARYAPLQDRYLLEHQDLPARGYAFRPALLDALENPPPVAVPAGAGWQLRVRLRVRHLPPPLRLPARMQPEWQLNSGWVSLP